MNKYTVTLTVALMTIGAYAQKESPISLECTSQKVVIETAANGSETEQLVPVTQIIPGEIVQYQLVCTNSGKEAAEKVKIENPIPAHTQYIEGSASIDGATLLFSADGGITFMPYAALMIKDKMVGNRPARAEEVTHVQWTLTQPLKPGGAKEVRYRVRLE